MSLTGDRALGVVNTRNPLERRRPGLAAMRVVSVVLVTL
jgi:hypothetical protein